MKDIKFKTPQPFVLNNTRIGDIARIETLRIATSALNPKERTGNWKGYLSVLRQMLPFLAAAGHNHYTRSVRWFLQNMIELPATNPAIHQMFQKGYFVVRRSDQHWTGISPDLCIEQSLMCSLKSSGGLTRGHGMEEVTRNIWVLSRPMCTSVIEHLRSLLSIYYQTSYHHAKLSESVSKRDNLDMRIIEEFVGDIDIFEGDLRNLANGIIAGTHVNVEESLLVGEKILKKMDNFPVKDYVFKKSNHHHQVMLIARIFQTRSLQSARSSIARGRSSG